MSQENNPEIEEAPFKPTSPTSKLDFSSLWEYDDAPQAADHVEIRDKYELFIGGRFVEPSKGRYLKSINPSNEEVLSEIAEATQQDVDDAVKAANKAFKKSWSSLSGKDRGKYIFRIARLIQERAREFAIIESMEESLFVNPVMWIFPWPQPISSIMPAGLINWNMLSLTDR